MISEAMMPIGTSLDGFLASSEWTETESNPIYAKKIIAAAGKHAQWLAATGGLTE